MSDDPVLTAVQKFMDAVEARLAEYKTEIRGTLDELRTREAPKAIEGPPGKDGTNGVDGKDGRDGIDGKPGERGADGIGTREALDEWFETRFAEVQVRGLADSFRDTWVRDTPYKRSELAIWNGTTWIAVADTKAEPGMSPDWKMFAKKGRDGRDRTDARR